MPRAVKRKAESTDVHVCGGLPRSSVEVSVMGMERRGGVLSQIQSPTLQIEDETMNEATFVIIIKLTKSKCEEPCEGRLSSTVPREGWVKIPPPYSTASLLGACPQQGVGMKVKNKP